jgi:hypothetical protein
MLCDICIVRATLVRGPRTMAAGEPSLVGCAALGYAAGYPEMQTLIALATEIRHEFILRVHIRSQ